MRLSIGVSARRSVMIASAAMVALGAFPIRAQQPASEKAEQQKKRLHTIPEDDMIKPNSFIPPKPIRDLIASREGEDLIICIAGCRPGEGKVVYAQPTTKISLKEREAVLEQQLRQDEDEDVPVSINAPQEPAAKPDTSTAEKESESRTSEGETPAMKPTFKPSSAENPPSADDGDTSQPSMTPEGEFEVNVD